MHSSGPHSGGVLVMNHQMDEAIIHPSIHPSIHPFNHSLTHSLTHSFIYSIHSFIYFLASGPRFGFCSCSGIWQVSSYHIHVVYDWWLQLSRVIRNPCSLQSMSFVVCLSVPQAVHQHWNLSIMLSGRLPVTSVVLIQRGWLPLKLQSTSPSSSKTPMWKWVADLSFCSMPILQSIHRLSQYALLQVHSSLLHDLSPDLSI